MEQSPCENLLEPITDPVFLCVVVYDSPQGHSHQEHVREYSINDLYNLHDDAIRKRDAYYSAANQRRLERGKLTPSLRYDVLKRDNGRCVLCGRTAADGIQLQVDHILPVAKGGRTELSNLRTLCSLCNAGKSDKYDPQGFN